MQFILDDKVDDTKAATTVGVQTSKGKQVDADLVVSNIRQSGVVNDEVFMFPSK